MLDKAAVMTHKTVTQAEFDQVYAWLPSPPSRFCTCFGPLAALAHAERARVVAQDAGLPLAPRCGGGTQGPQVRARAQHGRHLRCECSMSPLLPRTCPTAAQRCACARGGSVPRLRTLRRLGRILRESERPPHGLAHAGASRAQDKPLIKSAKTPLSPLSPCTRAMRRRSKKRTRRAGRWISCSMRTWSAPSRARTHARSSGASALHSSMGASCLARSQTELEEEEAHLAAELAASFVPYKEEEIEQEVVTSWKLTRVPDALAKELNTYLV